MLSFSTDKQSYTIGEEVKVMIPTPKSGRALITIENGSRVMEAHWLETEESSSVFKFKVTPQMAPNIYVHVSLMQPHARTNDLPIRLYGVAPVVVDDPGTRLDEAVHVGNFVELKQSSVGPGTKINHLSYVGDSLIGRGVNVGAGTITCNYDGANKHTTTIEDEVFIGSDTQLIAPVKVGRGATIGAGTTVTRDVEPDTLVYNRTERKTVKGWKKPVKRK